LLYDLTSTYFECDPPDTGKRRYGYSRDKRSDWVQVVIAPVVTPEGFPLCYEVMDGNTSDRTTLRQFLKKIEGQYGKARRVWIMDRGIPTEEVLTEMPGIENTDLLSGWNTEREVEQTRKAVVAAALGKSAREPECQIAQTRRRIVCAGM